MTIIAKYPGSCTKCGGAINPGDRIEWSRGGGSYHTKCPQTVVRSKEFLNSPGRQALQGRGRSDFFLGEKTAIELAFASRSKPGEDRLGQTIHETKGDYAGQYLTCVGLAAHYVSQDEADDFDLVGPGGSFESHWSILKYFRPATDEEAASLAAHEQKAATTKRFAELCDRSGDWAHDPNGTGDLRSEIEAEAGDRAAWVKIWSRVVGYSLHEAWRTPIGLISRHPVYDDSDRWLLLRWEAMSPEDAEMIRRAEAAK